MITDEMLRDAAARSCEIYVARLENGYDRNCQHQFSERFERKIRRLRRRADHPVLYKAMHRAAAVILAILIAGGAWITVDMEARAAFAGWVKEIYETFFVYRYDDNATDSSTIAPTISENYEPTWIPNGYVKSRELDTGGRISIIYANEDGNLLKINYIYDPNETNIFVSADGGNIKTVTVGEYQADLILFDDPDIGNGILWTDHNKHAFSISGCLSEDELIKLASSIYET